MWCTVWPYVSEKDSVVTSVEKFVLVPKLSSIGHFGVFGGFEMVLRDASRLLLVIVRTACVIQLRSIDRRPTFGHCWKFMLIDTVSRWLLIRNLSWPASMFVRLSTIKWMIQLGIRRLSVPSWNMTWCWLRLCPSFAFWIFQIAGRSWPRPQLATVSVAVNDGGVEQCETVTVRSWIIAELIWDARCSSLDAIDFTRDRCRHLSSRIWRCKKLLGNQNN